MVLDRFKEYFKHVIPYVTWDGWMSGVDKETEHFLNGGNMGK